MVSLEARTCEVCLRDRPGLTGLQMLSWGINIINILSMNHHVKWTSILLTASVDSRQSLGHHTAVLPEATLILFYRYLYAFEVVYSLGMSAVKISV